MRIASRLMVLFVLFGSFQATGQGADHRDTFPFSDSLEVMNGFCFTANQKKLFFSRPLTRARDQSGVYQTRIYQGKIRNHLLVRIKKLNFSNNVDYHPVLSLDGKYLFFNSFRSPHPNTVRDCCTNIWYTRRSLFGWSKPRYIKEINTEGYDGYVSVTRRGIYFCTAQKDGKGRKGIYFANFKGGYFSEPEYVKELDTPYDENDIYVDPDEKYLIVNLYAPVTKQLDFYLSIKHDGKWGELKKMEGVNSERVWELTPYVSPDKKWFIYEVNGMMRYVLLAPLLEKMGVGTDLK